MDVGRLANALSRPGIDPRTWVTLATVTAFHLDANDGPYVDVSILTDMMIDNDGNPVPHIETARVGSFYAGNGFGFYAPLAVDDEVVVGYPNGDPDHGLVVMARVWSNPDPPPTLANDHPADLCLQVQKDVTLRIQVFGAGNVVLGSENGKVLLGEEGADRGVARGPAQLGNGDAVGIVTVPNPAGVPPTIAVAGVLTFVGTGSLLFTPTDPTVPPVSGAIPLAGEIRTASDKVKSV